MKITRLAALAVLCVGLPASVSQAQSTFASSSGSFSTSEPSIELVNPGAEPRQELRYVPTLGAKQSVKMSIKLNLQGSVGQQQLPEWPTPTVTFVLDLTPTNIYEDGDIVYTTQISQANLEESGSTDAGIASKMRETLQSLVGVGGRGVMSGRGFNKELSFTAPENASASVLQMLKSAEQSIQQIGAPFPAEAVGAGASWRVTGESTQNGMKISQTSTYTIESWNENNVTLSLSVSQTAGRQDLTNANLPGSFKFELVNLQGDGTGKQTISFGLLAPSFATFDLTTVTESNLQQGQTNVPAKQTMNLAVAIETSID